jgi:hypothetical protein
MKVKARWVNMCLLSAFKNGEQILLKQQYQALSSFALLQNYLKSFAHIASTLGLAGIICIIPTLV